MPQFGTEYIVTMLRTSTVNDCYIQAVLYTVYIHIKQCACYRELCVILVGWL